MDNQLKLLHFIHTKREKDGFPPTMREMAKALKMSLGSMQDYTKKLIAAGYMTSAGKQIPRSYGLTESGLKLVRKGDHDK